MRWLCVRGERVTFGGPDGGPGLPLLLLGDAITYRLNVRNPGGLAPVEYLSLVPSLLEAPPDDLRVNVSRVDRVATRS